MKIIDFFESTEKRVFIDCRISALRDYFRYHGISFDSYDAFILGENICNYSVIFQVNQKVPIPMLIFMAGHLEVEKNIFDNLGLPFSEKVLSEENWKDEIRAKIDQDEPVYAIVDIRYITKKLLPNESTQVDIHCRSSILIYGYEEEAKRYYVNLKEEKNIGGTAITEEELAHAISSNTFPLKIERQYIESTIASSDKERIRQEYRKNILKAIIHICNVMFDGGYNIIEHHEVSGLIKTSIGFASVRDFIELLEEYKVFFQKSEGVLDNAVRERLLALALNIIRQFLMSGSNQCFRGEFGECLKHFAKKFEIPEFQFIGEKFVDVSKEWRNVTRELYAYSEKKGDEVQYIEKLKQDVELIYKEEYPLFQKLLEITKSYYQE